MYLNIIMNEIYKHLKDNKIKSEDAAININIKDEGNTLIGINETERIRYLLIGREGKTNYSYYEPVVEKCKGKKLCTYIIYH